VFRTVYVLSDSTGNLARHMLTALLTQFPQDALSVRARTFVDTPRKVDGVFREAAATPGMIFHAVVSPEVKRAIVSNGKRLGLPVCDLTGDFVQFLAAHSGLEPTHDAQRLHHMDDAYDRRIKAIEFALDHDDAQGLESLHEAEIVLAGVSRTSKTPTTVYLAQQGFKVGNVALAMEVEPPRELLTLDARKVIGLTIQPHELADIRARRGEQWRLGKSVYNEFDHVEREIRWSRDLFRRQGWQVLDVTHQAIEETAARVVSLLGLTPPTGM
jgi:[pyruvate, water dikinase]-phosphate phosphotransferase / [pyruvate, water dikinase] kinase